MFRKVVIALVLVVNASVGVAAETKFDLICGGTTLHIDLDAGEWCKFDCRQINKIVSVTSGKIVLADQRPSHPRGDANIKEVNRITGEYSDEFKAGEFAWNTREACRPAPLTVLGQTKPKF